MSLPLIESIHVISEDLMNIQTVELFFFWCMIINLGLMIVSFTLVTIFRSFVLRIHSRVMCVPEDYVAKAIYAFLGAYKLLTFFFVIIPWIALKIIHP